jgi:hypothetical protein
VAGITTHPGSAAAAITTVTGWQARPAISATHTPPARFTVGTALGITLNADASTTAARLYYRHVNQADTWQSVVMTKSGTMFQATIPGSYTQTLYPLQYYFALTKSSGGVLMPGLSATLDNQPYYVVRSVNQSTRRPAPERVAQSGAAITSLAVHQSNRTIEIRYALNRPANVSAKLFDCKGRVVAACTDSFQSAGHKTSRVEPGQGKLSTGTYVLQIVAAGSKISKTVVISE